MINRFLFIPIVFLCISAVFAQPQQDSKVFKHEVGTAIGGILTSAISGNFEYAANRPLGLFYKFVNGKWAGRLGYLYNFNNTLAGFQYDPIPLQNGKIQKFSSQDEFRQHVLRLGAEYRIPLKRNIQLVFGADLLCRYFSENQILSSSIGTVDTVINPGMPTQRIEYSEIQTSVHERRKLSSWQYGLGISGGFLFPMGNRWWLSSNMRINSFYGMNQKRTYSGDGFVRESSESSWLEVNNSWFISELSVFYRF